MSPFTNPFYLCIVFPVYFLLFVLQSAVRSQPGYISTCGVYSDLKDMSFIWPIQTELYTYVVQISLHCCLCKHSSRKQLNYLAIVVCFLLSMLQVAVRSQPVYIFIYGVYSNLKRQSFYTSLYKLSYIHIRHRLVFFVTYSISCNIVLCLLLFFCLQYKNIL